MQIVKWQDSLAVALPADVIETLQLREGDEVDLEVTGERRLAVSPKMTREEALERIRALQRPLPADWKWDREEANARR